MGERALRRRKCAAQSGRISRLKQKNNSIRSGLTARSIHQAVTALVGTGWLSALAISTGLTAGAATPFRRAMPPGRAHMRSQYLATVAV